MRFTAAAALISVLALSGGGESITQFTADARKPSRPSSAGSRGPSASRSSRSRGSSGRGSAPAPVSKRKALEVDEYGYDEYEKDEDDFEDPDFLGGLMEDDDEEDEYSDVVGKPARPSASSRGGKASRKSRSASASASPARSKRAPAPARFEDEYEVEDYDDNDDYLDEYEPPSRSRNAPSRRPSPSGRNKNSRRASASASAPSRRAPPPSRDRVRDSRGGRGSRDSRGRHSGRPSGRGGRGHAGHMVPYTRQQESTFTRGLSALRENLPDPNAMKNNALSAMAAAKQRTSKISTGVFREIKGLTSSELEQVMLKSTTPNDTPVKGKHVERLVGVTYQISGRYDIYDAVLRKLWNKMTEADWRTKIKSLYVLHRFSSDGAPDHQASLKARLRELRRTRDPKRKDKYFSSKLLLAGDATPENIKYRAFLARYAHYVLLRAQCFGGMFADISMEQEIDTKKSASASASNKSITATALRTEHLEAATLLLKAGCAASLKEGETCEHTAVAMERVAADMIGMTAAVATALNRALKSKHLNTDPNIDKALLKRWCEFYAEELLPKTKILVKRTSHKLDKYGLFLPSRMGASVSADLLERGLSLGDETEIETNQAEAEAESDDQVAAADDASQGQKSDSDVTSTASATKTASEEAETSKGVQDEEDEEEASEDEDEESEEIEKEEKEDKAISSAAAASTEYDEEYDYEDEEYYDEE